MNKDKNKRFGFSDITEIKLTDPPAPQKNKDPKHSKAYEAALDAVDNMDKSRNH